MNKNFRELSNEELKGLKEKFSCRQLSLRYRVSLSTIKRRLKKLKGETENLNLFQSILWLSSGAKNLPAPKVRQQVFALIKNIRQELTDSQKKLFLLILIRRGYSGISELQEATKIERPVIESFLIELESDGKVYKISRGSHSNKGRKTKYLYFPTDTKKK